MSNEFNQLPYSKRTQIVNQHGREILVEHHYPIHEGSGFQARKRKIEEGLYEVFQKNCDKNSETG